jgi:hypothetical protein
MAQRSLHVITKVYYRSYARLCYGSTQYHSIANVFRGSHGTMASLAPREPRRVITSISYSSERFTLPTVPLISRQAVPYWTHGVTYCPGVSTPQTRSLVDLSLTIHIMWWIPIISTISTHAQTTTSILTTVTSHHDEWKTKTLNNNTSQTQHHKDGKTSTTLMTAWLSITNQVWNQILKYEA